MKTVGPVQSAPTRLIVSQLHLNLSDYLSNQVHKNKYGDGDIV